MIYSLNFSNHPFPPFIFVIWIGTLKKMLKVIYPEINRKFGPEKVNMFQVFVKYLRYQEKQTDPIFYYCNAKKKKKENVISDS